MKLNDPFGRMAQQQQIDYAALHQSLADAGIDSQAKAKALLANIRQRALVMAGLVVVLAAAIVFFLPHLKAMVMIFAALPLLWLFTTTVKGQRLIRRYIAEELADKS
jgi:hypothetical protein